MNFTLIKSNRGFSFIELVIALTIISILFVSYTKIITDTKENIKILADNQKASIIKAEIINYIFQSNDIELKSIGTGLTDITLINALKSNSNIIPSTFLDGDSVGTFTGYISNSDFKPNQRNKRGWSISINKNTLEITVVSNKETNIPIKFIP